MANEVSNEDLVFRRYKTLIIPIDGLLNQTSGYSLIEIIDYFLRYSTVKSIDNLEEDEDIGIKKKKFPFKCIGFV
jgi:hypothetical protein